MFFLSVVVLQVISICLFLNRLLLLENTSECLNRFLKQILNCVWCPCALPVTSFLECIWFFTIQTNRHVYTQSLCNTWGAKASFNALLFTLLSYFKLCDMHLWVLSKWSGVDCKGRFCMIDLTGFFPAERSVEEDLPQQYGHGVSGPPLLATHLPELHRGKRTGQLALEEWHSFEQVWKGIKTLLLDAVKRNLNI